MIAEEFRDKTVLVTGGSRGIGREIVKRYMELGANVAFTYIVNKERAEDLVSSYSTYSNRICSYQLDMGNADEVTQVSRKMIADFGGFDILINNAGMTRDGYFLMTKKKNITDIISADLVGMMFLTQMILPGMMKRKGGAIVNISSLTALIGNPGQTNYAAAKAGVIGFTKTLSLEVAAYNVRVNAVSPGYIDTDILDTIPDDIMADFTKIVPMNRLGSADEVTGPVIFLTSHMSSFVTGQNIVVSGGA